MIVEVCKAALALFEQNVSPNTVFATHADFVELAKLPAVILYWPEVEELRINQDRTVVKNPDGTTTITPPPQLYTLRFECEILAETLADLGALQDKIALLFAANPYWSVQGTEYPVRLESLATGTVREGEVSIPHR